MVFLAFKDARPWNRDVAERSRLIRGRRHLDPLIKLLMRQSIRRSFTVNYSPVRNYSRPHVVRPAAPAVCAHYCAAAENRSRIFREVLLRFLLRHRRFSGCFSRWTHGFLSCSERELRGPVAQVSHGPDVLPVTWPNIERNKAPTPTSGRPGLNLSSFTTGLLVEGRSSHYISCLWSGQSNLT